MFSRRVNRWDPIHQLRDEMARLLDDFSQTAPLVGRPGWRPTGVFPALNVWEDGQNLYAEAELPGFRMEDLEVSVAGNELSIKGERKDEHQEKGACHRRERATGLFNRVLRLPVDIDANKVEATLKDGILFITLPKAEQAKPRKVQVKALRKE
jgi:HSP20 family protein